LIKVPEAAKNIPSKQQELERNGIGKCPKCKKSLREFPKSYSCTKECGFVVWKEISQKRISQAQVKKLLEKGITDLISGFVSKSGKEFSAKLKLDGDGKVSFDFDSDKETKSGKKGVKK
jgi:DNA topoisomerase-3